MPPDDREGARCAVEVGVHPGPLWVSSDGRLIVCDRHKEHFQTAYDDYSHLEPWELSLYTGGIEMSEPEVRLLPAQRRAIAALMGRWDERARDPIKSHGTSPVWSQAINELREVTGVVAGVGYDLTDYDDPLHPFMPVGDEQQFRDWRDFYDRVCLPLVESEDEATIQAAMALYRQASPHFIATCMFFASGRGQHGLTARAALSTQEESK